MSLFIEIALAVLLSFMAVLFGWKKVLLASSIALCLFVLLFFSANYFINRRTKREKERKVYANRFVFVEDNGSVRALTESEKAHLNTDFEPGNGGRPYIKSKYDQCTPDGRLGGYLEKSRLPEYLQN